MSVAHLHSANGVNGVDSLANAVPGPSKSILPVSPLLSQPDLAPEPNGHAAPLPTPIVPGVVNNQACLDHLYHNGFRQGHWADTIVRIQGNAYNMHALLLGRSPFLAHLMSTTPLVPSSGNGPMRSIYVPIETEPEITAEAVTLAIGYLYSSVALSGINAENARAVLAAGCMLGGMDDLCQYAYQVCQASINLETIDDWLRFLERVTPKEEPSSGSATPTTPHLRSAGIQGPFTSYALRLRDDVIHFLIVELPSKLEAFSQDTDNNGQQALMDVYSRVPFDIFKKAVESPLLAISSVHSRFRFAKSVVDLRKKAGGNAFLTGADETVVLAFGGPSGGNIHVTRKVKKRPLWKVGN